MKSRLYTAWFFFGAAVVTSAFVAALLDVFGLYAVGSAGIVGFLAGPLFFRRTQVSGRARGGLVDGIVITIVAWAAAICAAIAHIALKDPDADLALISFLALLVSVIILPAALLLGALAGLALRAVILRGDI